MKLILVPLDKLASVSGKWGQYKLKPRPLKTGLGVLNPIVLNDKNIPQQVRDLLAVCDIVEINKTDFPDNPKGRG